MDEWVQHKAVTSLVLCKNRNASQELEIGICVRITPGDAYDSLLTFGETEYIPG